MKFIYNIIFCLLSFNLFAQGGVELKIEARTQNCTTGIYIVDLYIKHNIKTAQHYVGNSSIFFEYNADVLKYTGRYKSTAFNETPLCDSRYGNYTPYSAHSVDGKTAGKFLITLNLSNPTINTVYACPSIDSWVKIGEVYFHVLDDSSSPQIKFVGTQRGIPTNTRGTNLTDDSNRKKYRQFLKEQSSPSYKRLCNNNQEYKINNSIREQVVNHNDYKVFPNPIKDILYVESITDNIEKLKIIDIKGRVLMYKNYIKEQQIALNMTGLVSGTYFVVINDNTIKEVVVAD